MKKSRRAANTIEPTEEQLAIVSTEPVLGKALFINAYAGTGKTTTLELIAKAHPNKLLLYICFNRETADLAKRRFPKNAHCRTIHSLAFAHTGTAFREKIGDPRPLEVMRRLRLNEPFIAVYVIQAVQQFLYTTDRQINSRHLPEGAKTCGIPEGKIVSLANDLWLLMQNQEDPMPMTHDGYLKLWFLETPKLDYYDIILLDEAQDTNPVVGTSINPLKPLDLIRTN